MATSVLSVLNMIGTGIGLLLPGMIVGEDRDTQRDKIRDLLILEALIIVPLNLITLVCMRSKPPTPPRYAERSYLASQQRRRRNRSRKPSKN